MEVGNPCVEQQQHVSSLPAEQYVSSKTMVAFATSLLEHPYRGPSLRNKIKRLYYGHADKQRIMLERVERDVRAALQREVCAALSLASGYLSRQACAACGRLSPARGRWGAGSSAARSACSELVWSSARGGGTLTLWSDDKTQVEPATKTLWSDDEPQVLEPAEQSVHVSRAAPRAQQDVSPLPAEHAQYVSSKTMVTLATSLLEHPYRGPSLQNKIDKSYGHAYKERILLEGVEGEVRAALECGHLRRKVCAACGHLSLVDACAFVTELTYALLPLCVTAEDPFYGMLRLECADAGRGRHAVAAFYASLEQPTCAVTNLVIEGAAFGTREAAAHLGHCLDVNSIIEHLNIINVDGFCGEAVWTAFSHALKANATLQTLLVEGGGYGTGNSRHIAATLADSHKLSALQHVTFRDSALVQGAQLVTLEDMEGWGTMLRHNSTITDLHLGLLLPQGGGLLVPVCEALITNTTLQILTIACNHGVQPPQSHEEVEEVPSMDADTRSLAAMLRTNQSLTHLDILNSGVVCNGAVFDEGLSINTTLEKLYISVDAAGAQALMTAMAALGDSTTSNVGPRLKSLHLGDIDYTILRVSQCFPTAVALGDMLTCNMTLSELHLASAPYSDQEWVTTILPSLYDNNSLKKLDLQLCHGVQGGLVYDALLELLDFNTCITNIDLRSTPLDNDGKAPGVKVVIEANIEYGAALKNVPTVAPTCCRLVLCGYPFAGKTTFMQTMMHRNSSCATATATTIPRTRGVDIQELTVDLTMWIWDFAGQREFHPMQDFIFPNASTVHAATAFIFTFNPISDVGIAGHVRLKSKHQFQQEFFTGSDSYVPTANHGLLANTSHLSWL